MSLAGEFKTFMMRGNVVDLAVGVVIGGAFGKIVSSLVTDIIMPPIGLITGGVDFSSKKIILRAADPVHKITETAIGYGSFINTVIQFLIVGAAIFLVVKAINKLMPPPPVVIAEPGPTEVELLTQIRDALRKNAGE